MLKKAAIAGAGVILLMGLFFGRDACSYMSTSWGWVHQTVRGSVPIEFELERAQNMIANLEPAIHNNRHLIAKQEVEVDDLREHLQGAKNQLAKSLNDINRLRADLERNESFYVYAGETYTVDQVTKDLTNRWDHYQTKEATVKKLGELLDARVRGLKAAHDKLGEMQVAKQSLKAQVAELQARLELVKVAQTASEVTFDDSHLSRTKKLVKEIGSRIKVAENMMHADGEIQGQIDLDGAAKRDVLKEIAGHFGEGSPEDGTIVLDN